MTKEQLQALRNGANAYDEVSTYLTEGEHEAIFLAVTKTTNNGREALTIHFDIDGTEYRQMYFDKTMYNRDIASYSRQVSVEPKPSNLYDKLLKIRVQYNGDFLNIYPRGTAQTTESEPVVTEDLF